MDCRVEVLDMLLDSQESRANKRRYSQASVRYKHSPALRLLYPTNSPPDRFSLVLWSHSRGREGFRY